MNTPKTILGMLMISVVALTGTAAAIGGEVGGLLGAEADAQASYGVGYSGALDAADSLKAQAQAQAEATLDDVQDAVGEAKATTSAKGTMAANNAMKSSVDAKLGVFEAAQGNLASTAGWFGSLFVKPTVTPPTSAHAANVAKDITTDIRPGYIGVDAIGHADLVEEIGGSYGLEYNLPPPPQPKLGFLGSVKASFEWIADLS